MEHRGACSADNDSGDGAGVMTQIPWDLFKQDFPQLNEQTTGCGSPLGHEHASAWRHAMWQSRRLLMMKCTIIKVFLGAVLLRTAALRSWCEAAGPSGSTASPAEPAGVACRVGMLFLPNDDKLAALARKTVEDVVAAEGRCHIVGWRDVPVVPEVVGPLAKVTEPRIVQVRARYARWAPAACA